MVIDADRAERHGQIEKAIKLYEELKPAFPNSAQLYFHLGKLYALQGENKKSEEALLECLKLKPRFFDAGVQLGYTYLAEKNFRKSKQLFQNILNYSPDNLDAIAGIAQIEFLVGDVQEAKEIYQRALEEDPTHEKSLDGYAEILIYEGKYDQAREIYQTLERKNPYESTYQKSEDQLQEEEKYPLQVTLQDAFKQERKEVIKIYEAFHKIYPRDEHYLLFQGRALYDSGDYEAAKNVYREALKIDPSNIVIKIELAKIYAQELDYEKSKPLLEEVLQAEPDSEEAHDLLKKIQKLVSSSLDSGYYHDLSNKAKELDKDGSHRQALKLYQELVAKFPNNSEFTNRLGYQYMALGHLQQAKDLYIQALKLDILNDDARVNLAYIYLQEKNYAESKRLFKAVLERAPQQVDALSGLGKIYTYEKKDNEAEELFKNALGNQSDNKESLWQLAQIKMRQKSYQEANLLYKELIKIDPENPIYHSRIFDIRQYTDPRLQIETRKEQEKQKELFGHKWNARLKNQADKVTLLWPLKTHKKDPLLFSLSYELRTEQQDDLLNHQIVYSSKVRTLKGKADFLITDHWRARAELALSLPSPFKKKALLKTKDENRLEPSLSFIYRNGADRGSVGIVTDSMIIKEFKKETAKLITRNHVQGNYQHEFKNWRAIGLEGSFISYHDPHRNNQKKATLWAQTGLFGLGRDLTLRYQFDWIKFNRQVDSYYSFKNQHTNWAILHYNKRKPNGFEYDLTYSFGLRRTVYKRFEQQLSNGSQPQPATATETIEPVQTNAGKKIQHLRMHVVQAIFRKRIEDKLLFEIEGQFSKDSQHYTTWAFRIGLTYQF